MSANPPTPIDPKLEWLLDGMLLARAVYDERQRHFPEEADPHEYLAARQRVHDYVEDVRGDDFDSIALEILCRVFDDGADEGMQEWLAFDKTGWLSPQRALGAFIYRRLERKPAGFTPTKNDLETVRRCAAVLDDDGRAHLAEDLGWVASRMESALDGDAGTCAACGRATRLNTCCECSIRRAQEDYASRKGNGAVADTCDLCGSSDEHPTATCKKFTIDLMKRLEKSLREGGSTPVSRDGGSSTTQPSLVAGTASDAGPLASPAPGGSNPVERVKYLEAALRELSQPRGRYSRDRLTHAQNVIEDMAALAEAALAGTWEVDDD